MVSGDLNLPMLSACSKIERIEAGLLSFGSDMDFNTTSLQCGLDRYCNLDRDLSSLSVAALADQKSQDVLSRLMSKVAPDFPAQCKDDAKEIDGGFGGDIII